MANVNAEDKSVLKCGLLIKIKTNRKKWFVLRYRGDGEVLPPSCQLEYYDDQKKFNNGSKPKRVIELNDCFNIGTKKDRKHNNVIVMYTKDDCFLIGCASEAESSDWLSQMWQLQSKISNKREVFENIWPVTVLRKGKAYSKLIIPGSYRLCMTPQKLDLVRTGHSDQKYSYTFSMIRRVGHRTNVFFFEVGRSAETGPGELYLQVEDDTIAESIHCAVVNHMKTSSFNISDTSSTFRNRSHSSAADRKRALTESKDSVSSYRAKTMSTSAISRSYTIDDSHKMASRRHSPTRGQRSTLRHGNCFPGPSLAVAGLSEFGDEYSAPGMMTSSTSSTPSSSPSVNCVLRSTPEECFLSHDLKDNCGYFSMNQSNASNTSSNYYTMSSISSDNTVSPIDCCDYIDMKPGMLPLETVLEKQLSDQQYLNMSPMSAHSQSITKAADRYLYSNLPDDTSYNEYPKRAYSVGSKASALASRLRCQIDDSYRYQQDRRSSSHDSTEVKSSSAPHLPFDDDNLANRDSSLFMEVDFARENTCVQRPRAYSSGQKEMRQRPFCHLSNIKTEATDHSVLHSSTFHSTLPRQRCRTISQENFKNKAPTYGDKMRPRSSSSGQRSNIQRPIVTLAMNKGMHSLDYNSLKALESGSDYLNMPAMKISDVEKKMLPRKSSLIGVSNSASDGSSERLSAKDESSVDYNKTSHDYMCFEPTPQKSERAAKILAVAMPERDTNIYVNLEPSVDESPPPRKAHPTRPVPVPKESASSHPVQTTTSSAAVPTSTMTSTPPTSIPEQRKLVPTRCELQHFESSDYRLKCDETETDPFNMGVKRSVEAAPPTLPVRRPAPVMPTRQAPLKTPSELLTGGQDDDDDEEEEDVGQGTNAEYPLLNYATLDISPSAVLQQRRVDVRNGSASSAASATTGGATDSTGGHAHGYTQIDFIESQQRHLKTGC